jgi:hypothetical protein
MESSIPDMFADLPALECVASVRYSVPWWFPVTPRRVCLLQQDTVPQRQRLHRQHPAVHRPLHLATVCHAGPLPVSVDALAR